MYAAFAQKAALFPFPRENKPPHYLQFIILDSPHMYPDKTLLGQGKCGPVFRATHPQSGQQVLLKILPPDGAAAAPLDDGTVQQLAPQWMQVSGFNIARLLGVEALEDGLALVSEYVAAPTVSSYPNKGKIPAGEALDVTNQLLNALLSGEKVRQMHGDVKPSNVLIGTQADGRPHVRLTDWGLNQARGTHPMETYLFTAPERLDGSAATPRADLFSVGNVMFFLLTGMALVKGRTPQEIAQAWKTASPDHLKKIRKDLPAKFVKFILTLLELKPEKRPASPSAAMKMLAELNPPSLPQPAAATRAVGAAATRAVVPGRAAAPATRPITPAASAVPVQAPMRPPAQVQSPGVPRPPATAGDDAVPIVSMRPPPEIAAQLHLPASVLQPEILQPGSQTQPFVTGAQTAIPQGTRTQPMQSRANVPTAQRSAGQGNQAQRRPGPPPAPPKSPLIPILTILVILSMIGCGVYFFLNKDKFLKPETKQEDSSDIKSASDLMNKIKNSGKK